MLNYEIEPLFIYLDVKKKVISVLLVSVIYNENVKKKILFRLQKYPFFNRVVDTQVDFDLLMKLSEGNKQHP